MEIDERYQPDIYEQVYTQIAGSLHPDCDFSMELPNFYVTLRSMGLTAFQDRNQATDFIIDLRHPLADTAQGFFFERLRELGYQGFADLAGKVHSAFTENSERFFYGTVPSLPEADFGIQRNGLQTLLEEVWDYTNATRLGLSIEDYMAAKDKSKLSTIEVAALVVTDEGDSE